MNRKYEIINCSTAKDEVAIYLVYCWLTKTSTNLFDELGLEIKHRANSKGYRVVDKNDTIQKN